MTLVIDRLAHRAACAVPAERPKLYQRLLSALMRPRKPQPLPGWLHADLGLPPTREREFVSRSR